MTDLEKADLLGERLVGGATEAAAIFTEELRKRFDAGLRNGDAATKLVIETIAFYMHLVDRLALGHLGAAGRETFGEQFMVAVVKEVLRELSTETPADDFCRRLRDAYNYRQLQYSKYRELIPQKGKPLKGTLYWEFSKILFTFFDDENPATLIFLNLLVADATSVMLTDAMQVEDVLAS